MSHTAKPSQPLPLKAASRVWLSISLRTFGGTAGGLIAGIMFVIPGYLPLMILSAIYARWGETVGIAAVFAGLGPAVLAIIAQALRRMGKRALTNNFLWAISSISFLALIVFNISFPIVVAGAAIIGVIANKSRPQWFVKPPVVVSEQALQPLIADEALQGDRATLAGFIKVLVVGLFLWVLPVAIAAVVLGRNHVFVQWLEVFFTSLLTPRSASKSLAHPAREFRRSTFHTTKNHYLNLALQDKMTQCRRTYGVCS